MKSRPWRVTRQHIAETNTTQRWDQAYQALLTWTLNPPTSTKCNAPEATDAHCLVCAGLDPAPSPEPRA